ncbi:MAG: [Fe-S]-binding protein, partial [Mucilaginibacter polytrichastri]|nr:[Fe-S]-binding protein [Mucilaginibacter polytrichastri]
DGMKEFKHLSYASSLCGKCSEVCPVHIDIHNMLLLNRRDAVKTDIVSLPEKWGWSIAKKGLMSRKMMDFFGGKTKNRLLGWLFSKTWAKRRDLPKVAEKSFSQQWKEKQNPQS